MAVCVKPVSLWLNKIPTKKGEYGNENPSPAEELLDLIGAGRGIVSQFFFKDVTPQARTRWETQIGFNGKIK